MAIKRLDFYGYRSFQQATWEPGNLNLLVGPNGSGKSNLLRLLELISNVARGKLAESINAVGGMVPLLWNQEAKALGWKLTLDNGFVHDLKISSSIGSGYSIASESLASMPTLEQDENSIPEWNYKRHRTEAWFRDPDTKQDVSIDKLNSDESLISQVNPPNSLAEIEDAQWDMTIWAVYQNIDVSQNAPLRQPVITQPAKSGSSDASNLAAVLHTHYTGDRDFKQRIDEGMRAAFGDEFVEIVFQPASARGYSLPSSGVPASSRTPAWSFPTARFGSSSC